MCGIVAQAGIPSMTPALERACRLIDHRGTRSHAVQSAGGIVHHARLPIVGLGIENDQPVRRVGSASSWTIAFVGEILDYQETKLGRHEPCDLPTVTRAWLKHGPTGLVDRDGFWSVVALSDAGVLHMVTDYLGQKPIYYRQDLRACASEPDAVAALGPVTPDEVYLSACVKWGYCPEVDRTPYNQIKRTRPGEHVAIDASGQIRRKIVDELRPLGTTPQELRAEIEAAVRRRVLSSDVPVACLLSGGLDSSIVYTLARRHGDVKPYYVYDEQEEIDQDEAEAVRAVAGPTSVTAMRWHDINVLEALQVMQEPIDLGSLIPQVALSRVVRETVCLTGDGADEVFGGYGRSLRYDSQMTDLFHELPCWHLPRLDRVMMRHQIEVRSPFLARRVVQMAMTLPWAVRQNKNYLRVMFAGDLPTGIAARQKKPLRRPEVERDRESVSRELVAMFRQEHWPDG